MKRKKKKIRVGFYMQNQTVWDKQKPLFEALTKDPRFEVLGIVIPSFEWYELGKRPYRYRGDEHEYFHSLYDNVADGLVREGEVLNLAQFNFDYLFATRPYDINLAPPFRADFTSKFTKVCYISYSTNWDDEEWLNRFKGFTNFFDHVYFYFAESEAARDKVAEFYAKSVANGEKKIEFLGYPALEELFKEDWPEPKMQLVWAPAYERKPNGKYIFLDYADNFLSLKETFPDLNLVYRPHPSLYGELTAQTGANQEVERIYGEKIAEKGILYDKSPQITETLKDTKILIMCKSGSIIRYFLKNRPAIYTPQDENDKLLAYGHSLLSGIYVANTWEEATAHIRHILEKGDTLSDKRKNIIDSIKSRHIGAVDRIAEALAKDFAGK